MSNEKTKSMIEKAKAGDQKAFTDLYNSYYQHAFCAAKMVLVGDNQSAEDATQEAFLKVFMKLQNGDDIEDFGGYINRAARNEAIDTLKRKNAKKRPQETLNTFDNLDSDNESDRDVVDSEHSEIQAALLKASSFNLLPEEKLEQKEIQEIVYDIISELPDYQQETLSLFYIEGLKQREIADIYGISVDTVKSRINQGKKKVEKKITELEQKKGIKLRSIAPLAFFFILLKNNTKAEAAARIPEGATFVSKMTKAGAIKGTKTGFFSKSLTIAGKSISTKLLTGIIIGAVGIGGVSGAVVYTHNKQEQKNIVNKENNIPETSAKTDDEKNDKYPKIVAKEFIGTWESTDGIFYTYIGKNGDYYSTPNKNNINGSIDHIDYCFIYEDDVHKLEDHIKSTCNIPADTKLNFSNDSSGNWYVNYDGSIDNHININLIPKTQISIYSDGTSTYSVNGTKQKASIVCGYNIKNDTGLIQFGNANNSLLYEVMYTNGIYHCSSEFYLTKVSD